MERSLVRALIVLSGCAASVYAQESEILTLPIAPKVVIGTTTTSLGPGLIVPVYNAIYDLCPSNPFAIGNGSSYVMEDVSFEPGPWGATYTGARDVVQVDGMFQTAGWTGYDPYPGTNTPRFYISHIFEFYEPGNFTTCPMLGNSTPIATRTVETNFGSGYAWNYTSPVFTSPVSLGTRVNVWVAVKAIDPGTGNRMSDGNPALMQPGGGGGTWIQQTAVTYGEWLGRSDHPCVGDTTEDYGRDQNPNGPVGNPGDFCGGSTFIVGSGAGNTNDRRRTAAGPFAPNGPRCLSLGLRGIITPNVPATTFDPPALPDGVTVLPFGIMPGVPAVQWTRLILPNPVIDSAARFLNIDTEGSTAGLALGLFDALGNLVAYDDNSGSGQNAQLTFGVGRAAGVGDGAQYDGRDGELPAGSYYLAVAPDQSFFGAAFMATPGPTTTEPRIGYVNIRTNVNNGSNLPPAVPPIINHFDFTTQGPAWTFPSADTFQGTTGDANPEPLNDDSSAVLWTKFAIDAPGAGGREYLDIDFSQSDTADNLAYLFDAQGALVAFSDDASATNPLPLMSFGASQPPRCDAPPSACWQGQNGLLPPGTYYLASVARPADVLTGPAGAAPIPGPDRRWHVRGLSDTNIGFTAEFYTGSGAACDPIDFNRDGVFPDVLDISDFLSVFSGGPCSNNPMCGDIDFNNDTIYPDTADVLVLLRVFAGGSCD